MIIFYISSPVFFLFFFFFLMWFLSSWSVLAICADFTVFERTIMFFFLLLCFCLCCNWAAVFYVPIFFKIEGQGFKKKHETVTNPRVGPSFSFPFFFF